MHNKKRCARGHSVFFPLSDRLYKNDGKIKQDAQRDLRAQKTAQKAHGTFARRNGDIGTFTALVTVRGIAAIETSRLAAKNRGTEQQHDHQRKDQQM